MYNQDWNIKPRGTECFLCHSHFEDGKQYVSRLLFEQGEYQREDYCDTCWAEHGQDDNSVSIWKAVFAAPPPPPEEPLKKETAESFLRRLIEQDDTTSKNVIFILAVMLERRRILVERDTNRREDGSFMRIYEHRKTGETFLIIDPMLDLNQIEHVQVEVMALLAGDQTPSENADAGLENNGRTAS